jgi:acetyl esterase/lipase
LNVSRILSILLVVAMSLTFAGSGWASDAAEFQLLWPDGAPGAVGDKDADKPGVWIYRATENPNGAAVVICPGGGYAIHATDHEGVQPARYFNRIGVTAFVLRYRLSPYRHPAPLNDAQQAIRYVRENAKEFGIDPHRVGIMGFSAGGHLASTALTHFDLVNASAEGGAGKQSSRPDFGILGYPVVSFVADFAHKGSAKNLLGESMGEDQLKELSNDLHVTAETPPVFLFHTSEDTGVPAENSLAFFAACQKAKVPAELHIYQQGPHGVGLANGHPALSQWIDAAGTWLRQNAILAPGKRQSVSGTINFKGQPLKWGTVALIPENPQAPVGWAMVRNGQFSIPEKSGPQAGPCEVVVTNLGEVAPGPTIDDARELARGQRVDVKDGGDNNLQLQFE